MKHRKTIECHSIQGGNSGLILFLSVDPSTQISTMQVYNSKDKEATPEYTFDESITNTLIYDVLTVGFINTGFMNQEDLREVLNFIRGESYA